MDPSVKYCQQEPAFCTETCQGVGLDPMKSFEVRKVIVTERGGKVGGLCRLQDLGQAQCAL